ncbi:hypothetical protein [Effusibacillus lacus]|uniref:Glycosyltransferase n=1 Tax=Effusibacillus lacus TaxID=1348429 RepID=A0A292YLJ6_9BACL|nr:hypothetical protein [Effusibacillus lacus]TCS73527.1 glycosyltransferase involved in cell wall biosynthesis [Effusibacillus lacus]GAX91977.1 hypothetical protein EFBL_3668 [Effusibacillus lacus]
MKKIKVGMVIPTWGQQCGVADYTKQLIEHTQDQSITVQVYSDVNPDLPSVMRKDGIDIAHFQYEHSIYDFTALYQILTALQQQSIPIVTTLHSWSSELACHNLLISGRSCIVIVHSEQMKQLCLADGFRQEQLAVMPIGCQSFPLQPADKTRKLFTINGHPSIGFFGFPFPHKGIANLMDALIELKAYFPDLKGYFFSHYPNYLDHEHPYYSFYQKLQTRFEKNDYLIWIKEYLPEPAIVNLLSTMDMNVLPYVEHNQKGISAAVRLMLAARRPVITTNYLYFSDLKNEVFKMPNAEADTIASSICRVFLHSSLQQELIAKGDLFLKDNSWEKVGRAYREFYKQNLSKKAGEERR